MTAKVVHSTRTPLAWPSPREVSSQSQRSPASVNVRGSNSALAVPRRLAIHSRMPWWPRKPSAGLSGISNGSMISQPSSNDAITASTSSRLKALSIVRTTSTWSSDIACPVSRLGVPAWNCSSGRGGSGGFDCCGPSSLRARRRSWQQRGHHSGEIRRSVPTVGGAASHHRRRTG